MRLSLVVRGEEDNLNHFNSIFLQTTSNTSIIGTARACLTLLTSLHFPDCCTFVSQSGVGELTQVSTRHVGGGRTPLIKDHPE
jgi:hypothetical protein